MEFMKRNVSRRIKLMKKQIQWFIKAILAGVITIIILSVFCYFYSYDGIHIASETGATDYVWEKGQLKATMKEEFSRVRMDNYGYNNFYDYSKDADVLLMGSSHMEAAQVSVTENVGYLLNEQMPELKTYNIGMSGHTIYRCVDNLGNALDTYKPKKYLVMVVDSVDLNIDEMMHVVDGTAEAIPSYDDGIVYYLQKIPSIKVIYKQLSDWISLSGESDAGSVKQEIDSNYESQYIQTLEQFLEIVETQTAKYSVKPIILYQPAQKIRDDGTIDYEYNEDNLKKFVEVCKDKDISFINMEEEFDNLYKNDKKLVHGFTNSSIGEGHLNKEGHIVIANAIVSETQKLEAE